MRVLLVRPPVAMGDIHPAHLMRKRGLWDSLIGEKGIVSGRAPVSGRQPPYSLMHLSAVLRPRGHEVHLSDCYDSTEQSMLACIREERIEFVGLSSMTYDWASACALASKIKASSPSVHVCIGGHHVNALGASCLEGVTGPDSAVAGEGEETLVELLDALEGGKEIRSLAGTIVPDGGGGWKANPARAHLDLDLLPFLDLGLIDLKRYRPSPLFYKRLPSSALFGSRGCPFHCSFCHADRRVRWRSAASLASEMEHARDRFGVRDLTFYDETFTLNRKRAIEICERLAERRIGVCWSANARVDTVTAELLGHMKRAGCWRILYGIESGVEKNLARIQKGVSLAQIRDAVVLTAKAGIESFGIFMFGIPGETYEEGRRTIDFARSLPLDYASFVHLAVFPGTRLYEEVKDEKGFLGFEHQRIFQIGYVPATMTRAELEDLMRRSFRAFYLRPRYILSRLGKVKSWEDFLRYLRGFLFLASSSRRETERSGGDEMDSGAEGEEVSRTGGPAH